MPDDQVDTPIDKPAEDDTVDIETEEGEGEEGTEEKYGLQVLRAIHEHASILLEEYDTMQNVLEHKGVKKHLLTQLERLAECLEETEGIFEKEYPDAEPLEHGVKDMGGEDPVEADSGEGAEGEDIPADEAIEGMSNEKSLKYKKKSANRCDLCGGAADSDDYSADGHYTICDNCMNKLSKKTQNYVTGGDMSDKEAAIRELNSKMKSMQNKNTKNLRPQVKHVCKNCQGTGAQGVKATMAPGTDLGAEEAQKKPGHGGTTDPSNPGDLDMGVEIGHDPGYEEMHQSDPGTDPSTLAPGTDLGFEEYQKGMIGSAAKYLKSDVAEHQGEWSGEKKMDAYHHHKCMMGIHKAFGPMDEQDCDTQVTEPDGNESYKNLKNSKKKDFAPVEAQDDVANVQEPDGNEIYKHLKSISGAAGFLKDLSSADELTDEHRMKALTWHKEIFPIGKEDGEANVNEGMTEGVTPGDIAEKNLPNVHLLKAAFKQQHSDIQVMTEKMNKWINATA